MESRITNILHTSVAHSKLTKITMARQFCCSGASMIGTTSSTTKTAIQASRIQKVLLTSHCGHLYLPIGVSTSFMSDSTSSPCRLILPPVVSRPSSVWLIPILAACAFRSIPIISRQTVFLSHTTCSRRCSLSSRFASTMSPFVPICAYASSMRSRFRVSVSMVLCWKGYAG